MRYFTPNESTREQILRALDMLIDQTDVEEANEILQALDRRYEDKRQIFSLDSFFFGSMITMSLDDEFQSHKPSLIHFRNQLTGKEPYWKTYALKYNFVEFFTIEMHEVFKNIAEFLGMIESPALQIEYKDRFETLHESLHIFLFDSLVPDHLSEMLLGLLIHSTLSLPVRRSSEEDTFDIASNELFDGFSLIRPPQNMMETYTHHTQYLRYLIKKIKGEDIVYVDIAIVPNHTMFNVR